MAPDTAFYDQRAASYAAASHDMDLRPLYARFLLHVAPADLPDVLRRLQRALRPGGVMFFNFKYGQGQRHSPDGRRFTDMDEAGVRALLDALPELSCLDMRTGEDDRAAELRERWIQVLVRRIPSSD